MVEAVCGVVGLNPREVEVLLWVACGLSDRQIAGRLVISERTVRGHVSSVLGKIGVGSRVQGALWALRFGLVEVGEAWLVVEQVQGLCDVPVGGVVPVADLRLVKGPDLPRWSERVVREIGEMVDHGERGGCVGAVGVVGCGSHV